ncbi:MAG: molybdate ABC transporter permease subunit [Proteobacteria bacterium]|nr:MAG: molybdate ABC transporter permease subunit [Pseudomonadota bacterium]
MDLQAFALSLKIAGLSTLALAILGLPLAYWLALAKPRGGALLEALFSLPLVLPPTVLGFYLLLVLGPAGLAFTFTGLLIASVISGMPFALQSFLAAFRGVNQAYLENSYTLGEGPVATFWRVALPLGKEGLFTGLILSFAHALGEFGVVLMIGGNIPGVSRTLSLSLYDQVVAFDYAAANRTAGLLLGISVAALVAVSVLRAKGRAS